MVAEAMWGGWVAGLNENKANSAQLELELGLSLAIYQIYMKDLGSKLRSL